MTILEECLSAMQEFCDRVEKGQVYSKYTYAKFKAIITKANNLKKDSHA